MVTVIQRQGSTGGDILQALNAILQGIETNRQRGQEADLLKQKLLAGQGEFVPAPAPPRSLLETLFGGSASPDTIRIGDSTYRFQPYPELGEAGARALGLTGQETQTVAPGQPLPLTDTPVGPALPSLPTPATSTTETVPAWATRLFGIAKDDRLEHGVGHWGSMTVPNTRGSILLRAPTSMRPRHPSP